MKKLNWWKCAVLAAGLAMFGQAPAASSYAGQERRDIKALSAEDVDAYLNGKGMGLAKAAELNGYPGPSHVLALAAELGLSAAQKARTESLFRSMEARAIEYGRPLVEEERRLDQMFLSKAINQRTLAASLKRIAELQASVRQVHLETHLAQVEILSPAQVSKYMTLRGYTDAPAGTPHSGHKH